MTLLRAQAPSFRAGLAGPHRRLVVCSSLSVIELCQRAIRAAALEFTGAAA
jgi:hypothetical protein